MYFVFMDKILKKKQPVLSHFIVILTDTASHTPPVYKNFVRHFLQVLKWDQANKYNTSVNKSKINKSRKLYQIKNIFTVSECLSCL